MLFFKPLKSFPNSDLLSSSLVHDTCRFWADKSVLEGWEAVSHQLSRSVDDLTLVLVQRMYVQMNSRPDPGDDQITEDVYRSRLTPRKCISLMRIYSGLVRTVECTPIRKRLAFWRNIDGANEKREKQVRNLKQKVQVSMTGNGGLCQYICTYS